MPGVDDAIAIWKAGVAAVEPRGLVRFAFPHLPESIRGAITNAPRILVVGGGKAGAAMALGLEDACQEYAGKLHGLVNIPKGVCNSPRRIRLHAARPAGSNFPTQDGIVGTKAMLDLLKSAGPDDIAICLLSGGGSALLPAPVPEITLEDKIITTRLLQDGGAGIIQLNCVRKHLSLIKGGRLTEAFRGRWFISLIISDVINDPLDVIASGPTCPDSTTFTHAMNMLDTYAGGASIPPSVRKYIEEGVRGDHPDTPKECQANVTNHLVGNNQCAMDAAFEDTVKLGFWTHQRYMKGEARREAMQFVAMIRARHTLYDGLKYGGPRKGGDPNGPPAFIFGGETTVTLGRNPGKGGRNQEFVLAMLCELGIEGMMGVTILCAGTDGEDGPTDAAGAIGTEETLLRAKALNLNPRDFLERHDSYHFFEATGGLFKTGLTGTNVMDLGVILLS